MAENPTNRAYFPFTKAGIALYNPFFKDGVYTPVLDLPVDEGFGRIPFGSDDEDIKYQVRLKDDKNTLVKDYNGDEKFVLQDGLYCPALQIAVKTMKIEEEALLFVKPQYGFGDKGKPAYGDEGPIPPNATLAIFLKLVSWKKITYYKTIIKEGQGYECPNKGAVVKLKILGKLLDNTVFLNKGYGDGDEAELFEFKTDEEQVVDGLDEAVMGMKKGEIASLTIPPQYAFGSSESQQELAVVPPNSTLHFLEKEIWDMNNEEKIEAARKKQEEGEALFRAGEDARASKRFEKALEFLRDRHSFSDEEKKIARILWCDCARDSVKCEPAEKPYEHEVRFFKELEEANLRNRQSQAPHEEYGGIIPSKDEYIWIL